MSLWLGVSSSTKTSDRVNPLTGQVTDKLNFITDPHQVERYYAQNLSKTGAVVRPRYLTLLDYPELPAGAIELYSSGMRKDVDILRDQLIESYHQSHGSNQIDAHIHTIRDRVKTIPCVVWGDQDSISQTVANAKAACEGAIVPIESVSVNISKAVVIDYCVSHCVDPFAVGALRGLDEYSRVASQETATGMTQLDYAIECGQKGLGATTTRSTVQFLHLDKPGVQKYLEKQSKRLCRSLRSVMYPPQFQSYTALVEQVKKMATEDEIFGMADLEAMPATTTETTTARSRTQATLRRELFTCPITLDIMEEPVTTTPCGHMFEKDAIEGYLRTVGNTCPICRSAVTTITQNYTFKNVIQAWLAQQDEQTS